MDQNLFQESLAEIDELATIVINGLIKISQSETEPTITSQLMPSIQRNIHSIKGALGMIGLKESMNSVHGLETFLNNVLTTNTLSAQHIELLIDYWWQFQDALLTDHKVVKPFVHFENCFKCLSSTEKTNTKCNHHAPTCTPKKVAAPAEEQRPSNIIFIGNCPKTLSVLEKNNLRFFNFSCINEIYRRLPLSTLKNIVAIYLDISSINTNPFLLLTVINQLNLNIRCCYLVNEKQELLKYLDDTYSIHPFHVIPKNSPRFEFDIINTA